MINPENDRNFHKLILSLNHKLSPSVYFVSCNTEKLRMQLYESITSGSPRFRHLLIDLTPHSVYSLRDAINQFVPGEVRTSAALTYVVHFTGISSSLFTSEGGTFKKSMLLEELNFEREILFQDYPFISFLWVNPFFYKELFWKAGDLMSWAFDRYEFTDESPEEVINEIPYKEPLQKQGAIPERTERIKELEDLLVRLDEEDQDQQKIMLQKTNALLLLGRENMKAFRWKEAEEYLLQAKQLIDKTASGTNIQIQVNFYLGDFYLATNKFQTSLRFYEQALELAKEIDENSIGNLYHRIGITYWKQRRWVEAMANYEKAIREMEKAGNEYLLGSTYHQIGIVQQEQNHWEQALTNYSKAIEWNEKTGNEYSLGGTYHQIGRMFSMQGRWKEAVANYKKAVEWKEKTGNEYALQSTYHQLGRVYAEQCQWKEALVNYSKAIEWKKKTKNEYDLGATYHQIGMVYQKQQSWNKALTNYQEAIEWKEKTGNEYELGSTYHQIGMVYQQQQRWEEALTNYQKAIEWREKTGNEYELGGTYHQIGRVYEEQGLFQKAKEYFEMSVKEILKYNNPNLAIAEASLERIKTKLGAEKKENP